MFGGFVRVIGDPVQEVAGRLADYRGQRERETGTRPRLRVAAFETGENPLLGVSWPPPRRSGFERDEQRDLYS